MFDQPSGFNTSLISNQTLRLEISAADYDFNQTSFTWHFESFLKDELKLKLDFEDPL